MPRVRINLSPNDLQRSIAIVRDYRERVAQVKEICRRLSDYGLLLADVSFNGVAYDGNKDVFVTVEETSNGYRILASGKTALILEFGAGITYGHGHPQEAEFGMGAGTYPGQKHALDPKGWRLPKSAGGGRTYGNPPSMSMYNAAQAIKREVQRVAEEVLLP